jgi:hypothetical protein
MVDKGQLPGANEAAERELRAATYNEASVLFPTIYNDTESGRWLNLKLWLEDRTEFWEKSHPLEDLFVDFLKTGEVGNPVWLTQLEAQMPAARETLKLFLTLQAQLFKAAKK